MRISVLAICLFGVPAITGCATFAPKPLEEVPFMERVQPQEREGLRVSVSVLTREETRQAYHFAIGEEIVRSTTGEKIKRITHPTTSSRSPTTRSISAFSRNSRIRRANCPNRISPSSSLRASRTRKREKPRRPNLSEAWSPTRRCQNT